jgi:hypothetical protein
MKKILGIVVLSLLLCGNIYAKTYQVDDVVEVEFIINKSFQIKLPSGKWIVAERSTEYYYGLTSKVYSLIRLENNKAIEAIEIAEMKTAGVYENAVNQAIYMALFKNKYDGCYARPEYTVVKFYAKGSSHNCFWLGHSDIYNDLFTPDDPDLMTANTQIKRWIKKNNVELPKVALFSNHTYFSRLKGGNWYALSYMIDPKVLGAPKNRYITEDTSEYHRNNIENYPEHKKIMKKWISTSAQRHIDFENSINALKRHRLDLNDLLPVKNDQKNELSLNIAEQLKSLGDLFKSGVLTKKEFDNAKKKLLN